MLYVGKRTTNIPITSPQKGKVYGGKWLVLDDLMNYTVSRHHWCVVKCMYCGKVKTAILHDLQHKKYPACRCKEQEIPKEKAHFYQMKDKFLSFLAEERNKAELERIYPEDAVRVAMYEELIAFLNSKPLKEKIREEK